MNLTDRQKDLLREFVKKVRDENYGEPFLAIGIREGMSFHPWGQGTQFAIDNIWNGDLETLDELGLITCTFNSKGNYQCSVRQLGYDAVDNDFSDTIFYSRQTINIGALVNEMTGGNIQAVGSVYNSEITQVVTDDDALSRKLEELAEELIASIEEILDKDLLLEYKKAASELQFELQKSRPDSSKLSKLLRTLAFFGDIEGTLSLVSRVWPYLYPFILLTIERLSHL